MLKNSFDFDYSFCLLLPFVIAVVTVATAAAAAAANAKNLLKYMRLIKCKGKTYTSRQELFNDELKLR